MQKLQLILGENVSLAKCSFSHFAEKNTLNKATHQFVNNNNNSYNSNSNRKQIGNHFEDYSLMYVATCISLFLSFSLSLFLSFSLSLFLSFSLSLSLNVPVSHHISLCLSLSLSVWMFVYLSDCCLAISPLMSVSLSLSLSSLFLFFIFFSVSRRNTKEMKPTLNNDHWSLASFLTICVRASV